MTSSVTEGDDPTGASTTTKTPGRGTTPVLDSLTEKGRIPPRAAGILRVAGVPVIALVIVVWVATAVLRSGGAAQPHLYAEFVDVPGHSYLDVQLDPSQDSYGTFSVTLPGQERVWPAKGVTVRPAGEGRLDLTYDGAGWRGPASDQVEVPVDQRVKPKRAHVRLTGQVDQARHVATVDVWVDGDHQRVSGGSVGEPDETVTAVVEALRARNWNQVYDLASPYMINGTKRGDFLVALGDGGAARQITRVDVLGPPQRSTSPEGASYARVPVRVTYGLETGTTSVLADLVLAVDRGSWKLLSLE